MKRTALIFSVAMMLSGASVFAAGEGDKPAEPAADNAPKKECRFSCQAVKQTLSNHKKKLLAGLGVVVVAGVAYKVYKARTQASEEEQEA